MRHFKKISLILIVQLASLTALAQFVPLDSLRNAQLVNSMGEKQNLSFGSEKSLYAIVFLSPECPLCRNYTLTLNKLNEKYKKEVRLLGIIPGKSYGLKDMNQFIADYSINFPVYMDTEKIFSEFLNAKVTPEVFLLETSGRVIYSGKIDNWAISLGQTRRVATENYLENAIEHHLIGETITTRHTQAVGCLINMY